MSEKNVGVHNYDSFNYEFDYSLKINNNILIHRDFNIRNYNKLFRESLEYKELESELVGDFRTGHPGLITNVLKKSSINQCWENFNPNRVQSVEESLNVDDMGKSDVFTFEVTQKVGSKREVIFTTNFSGDPYQPKTRVRIDIKDELPQVLETIRFHMSKSKYTKKYGSVTLNRLNNLGKRELNECK